MHQIHSCLFKVNLASDFHFILLDHFSLFTGSFPSEHKTISLPLNSFIKSTNKQTTTKKKPLAYIFQYSPPHSFTTKLLLLKISFPVSQSGWAAKFSPRTSLPHPSYFLGDISHLIHAENVHILT